VQQALIRGAGSNNPLKRTRINGSSDMRELDGSCFLHSLFAFQNDQSERQKKYFEKSAGIKLECAGSNSPAQLMRNKPFSQKVLVAQKIAVQDMGQDFVYPTNLPSPPFRF